MFVRTQMSHLNGMCLSSAFPQVSFREVDKHSIKTQVKR